MIALVQMLEILNIKVISMLMHFVTAYRFTIVANYVVSISSVLNTSIFSRNIRKIDRIFNKSHY